MYTYVVFAIGEVHCASILILLTEFFRSKIFIRFPATLFNTEDLYQQKKHDLGESKHEKLMTKN